MGETVDEAIKRLREEGIREKRGLMKKNATILVSTSPLYELIETNCVECSADIYEYWPREREEVRLRRLRCHNCLAAEFRR